MTRVGVWIALCLLGAPLVHAQQFAPVPPPAPGRSSAPVIPLSHTALLAYIAISSLQFVAASSEHEALWQFALLMGSNMCLMGFIGANFTSIALQPFGAIAGAAASVQTFLRMVTASLIGAAIGQAYEGTARPLAMALLIAGSVALLAVLFSEKGRLFRRLHYPAKAAH